MELLDFINNNKDWRVLLSQKPYCIDIKEKDNYALFKYNQIESDMSLRIVQISRGIIIDLNTMQIVCRAFDKFFNYGESQAAKLYGKIRAEEKIDGSIMKMWFDKDKWNVSTNGMIDAADANLMMPFNDIKTYKDLFNYAKDGTNISDSAFDKAYTYIFELISPLNRIVVPYKETELCFLGMRNNKTGEEISPIDVDKNFTRLFRLPQIYPISTLEDAIVVAKTLGADKEGFVLVDENFNRVKVKGAEYLAMHLIRNNDLSLKNFLATVLNNTQDDLIAYFPEYKPYITEIENRLKSYIGEVENSIKLAPWDKDRKEFALAIKEDENSDILFKLYGNKNYDWKKEVLSIDKLNKLATKIKI